MGMIRALEEHDLERVLRFTDENIGQGYFTREKLQKIYQASQKNGVMCSYVLVDGEEIGGIRLTYPPGQWLEKDPRQPIHPHLWKADLDEAGYFQSLFISPRYQGQGFGKRLSMAAIESLKQAGARAVICHSWDESPENSSRRYLNALGFEPVISIPHFWKCIDYECTRCGNPCLCTATEMVFYI